MLLGQIKTWISSVYTVFVPFVRRISQHGLSRPCRGNGPYKSYCLIHKQEGKYCTPITHTVFGPFTMRIFQARIVPSVLRKQANRAI